MIDLLAIMAHPDDAELLCGGTLIRAADQGYRTGILDLTVGEAGTLGSADIRTLEAQRSAEILGLTVRRNAGLPDAALENTPAARATVAAILRELRPRVVILHGDSARHPDHRAARELGRDACFVAGLSRAPIPGEAFRPHKILYALSFVEPSAHSKPTFVVDITDQMDRKLQAIGAFESQFSGKTWAGDVFGSEQRSLADQIRVHCAHYGSLIRRPYGEPFYTRETMAVEDVVALDVRSM
ncbi:MAG TPA: bacillithiol biosynthesis deacetylase BshB1 [Longimicrobiales bacterium]|nr:bacillithiol biosynthesis deacetylase BshB1 [Longimicrobiales bacterium]